MTESRVRLFRREDRADLFRIAADTAFFGAPIETYFDDRRLFLDAFYSYYTDFEPEHCWVAEMSGPVVGFITGCTDTRMHDVILQKQITPAVIRRVLRGKYGIGWKTLVYALRLGVSDLKKEFSTVDVKLYPAHLHINVDERARGLGLGRELIETYLSQLCGLRIPGVHLMTTSQNAVACKLYEKMGFQKTDVRLTGLWRGIISEPVEMRTYTMRL
jgi:ribosomal protein S18 acetylase RimI-like enzyme